MKRASCPVEQWITHINHEEILFWFRAGPEFLVQVPEVIKIALLNSFSKKKSNKTVLLTEIHGCKKSAELSQN